MGPSLTFEVTANKNNGLYCRHFASFIILQYFMEKQILVRTLFELVRRSLFEGLFEAACSNPCSISLFESMFENQSENAWSSYDACTRACTSLVRSLYEHFSSQAHCDVVCPVRPCSKWLYEALRKGLFKGLCEVRLNNH